MSDDYQKQVIKRIAQLSDERVMWRMQQTGYWQGALPPDPPEELKERAELEEELAKLQATAVVRGDVDQALQDERKRRFKESIERRKANKLAKAQAREQAKSEFARYKDTQVLHLGRGVSSGLQLSAESTGDANQLRSLSLPVLLSADALANAMGISLGELRWLSYHRVATPTVHYSRFEIPKKSGGLRLISAPKPKLKATQTWIWQQILQLLPKAAQAHGFVPERSSLTNASAHCGNKVVINIDLKDFFPSIGFVRVRELFVSFGYPRRVATILALLCTEPPRVAGQIDGDVKQQTIYVAVGERALPQGACTSPDLSNLIARGLDRRLSALAKKLGFDYTRYADDLSFSSDQLDRVGELLGLVRRIVGDEGFSVHPEKTKVMHCSQKQEVTGLTVNQSSPHLPRAEKRRLRAMLHNSAKRGLDAANLEKLPFFRHHLQGWVAYASMAEPERAEHWQAAYRAII